MSTISELAANPFLDPDKSENHTGPAFYENPFLDATEAQQIDPNRYIPEPNMIQSLVSMNFPKGVKNFLDKDLNPSNPVHVRAVELATKLLNITKRVPANLSLNDALKYTSDWAMTKDHLNKFLTQANKA